MAAVVVLIVEILSNVVVFKSDSGLEITNTAVVLIVLSGLMLVLVIGVLVLLVVLLVLVLLVLLVLLASTSPVFLLIFLPIFHPSDQEGSDVLVSSVTNVLTNISSRQN